jgi:hypothetical protein
VAEQVTCGACGGTGRVWRYEPWEQALRINAMHVEFAEQDVKHDDGIHLVSVDVEGSYPTGLLVGTIYRSETDIEAVERMLQHWPRRDDDIYTHPLNGQSGVYEPVDPRFWEGVIDG